MEKMGEGGGAKERGAVERTGGGGGGEEAEGRRPCIPVAFRPREVGKLD